MRTLVLFLLVACAGLTGLQAQSIKYKKLAKVKITDAGELYSNYEWSSEEREGVKAQLKDQALVDLVEKYSKDSDWPENMKDFEWRIANPEKIQSLKVRLVATMGDDKYLLIVPAKENKKAPFPVKRDMFILIRKVAVQV